MYGYNIFAVLTPCDEEDKARTAFALEENATWFHSAPGGIAEEPAIDSRAPTPAPPTPGDGGDGATTCSIILTLDKPLKNPLNGFQFGTNTHCDVLLGHRGTRGVSGHHAKMTIDDCLRVWLHDHSTYGTAVGYNHQAENEIRTKDTWILAYEPGVCPPWNDVRVYIAGLAFKVDFPNHTAGHPQYVENLRAFVERSNAALPPVGGLELDNPLTAEPSRPRTPGPRPIYYKDRLLGKGDFGEVHKVINTRDGMVYAAKTFFAPAEPARLGKKRKHDEISTYDKWLEGVRNEVSIMRDNCHVSVPSSLPVLWVRTARLLTCVRFA